MIRSEALDIALESRSNAMWWTLSGSFHNEQTPSIREKMLSLVNDGCRSFIIDMENVTTVDDAVVPMFLGLLNTLKGKGGNIKFIFKNDTICRAFLPYVNLFSIFPDADALSRENAVLGFLKKRGKALTKKTGFRISRSVALFGLIVLCGWFLTLLYIINMQNQRIQSQQSELEELVLWKVTAEIDMEKMKERLLPLEQLGIVKDEPIKNK